jgi:hypothetical protein
MVIIRYGLNGRRRRSIAKGFTYDMTQRSMEIFMQTLQMAANEVSNELKKKRYYAKGDRARCTKACIYPCYFKLAASRTFNQAWCYWGSAPEPPPTTRPINSPLPPAIRQLPHRRGVGWVGVTGGGGGSLPVG